jgi:hypothetical protein
VGWLTHHPPSIDCRSLTRKAWSAHEPLLDQDRQRAGVGADSSMVRRGSTVRVRQRALQKSRKPVAFRSERLAEAPVCGRYGAVYGAFRSTTTGDNDHSGLNPAARRLRASSGSLPSVKRARSRAGTTYVLNRGPQSWTSDGSSQVDDHSHGRGRGSRGERRGACCPAGLPTPQAEASESRAAAARRARRRAVGRRVSATASARAVIVSLQYV